MREQDRIEQGSSPPRSLPDKVLIENNQKGTGDGRVRGEGGEEGGGGERGGRGGYNG